MKAARIIEPYKVEIIDLPEPQIGPEDVLIKVKLLGLCGSDLATYRGLNPMVSYPRIPGHEVCGEIVKLASNVPAGFGIGDKVTISPYTACGSCFACRTGRHNCCRYNQTMGVQRDGAAAEYVAVPYRKVFKSNDLTDEQVALIEPLSVGWHAAKRGQVCEQDVVV
ncbi:MAG TPA: sorbitol dehydrogenase, partial [Proteobacteria bacterium]|nr:sorbitol dehydrogenase [Pseudomonadota bacterium]